jgi:hypothetical protein
MSKAVNAILGIGIAIILTLLFVQGLSLVFPEPEFEDCWNEFPSKLNTSEAELEINREKSQECYDAQNEAREPWRLKKFLASVIIGLLLVLAILALLDKSHIAAGVGASGIALIVYGFMFGWDASSEALRFLLLLIAAAVLLGLAFWISKKK